MTIHLLEGKKTVTWLIAMSRPLTLSCRPNTCLELLATSAPARKGNII